MSAMPGTSSGGQEIKVEPLRSLNDFILESARFQTPNFKELEQWNRRVKENLIYYQSNYFLLAILIFLCVGIIHPKDMIIGMALTLVTIFLYVYVSKNSTLVMDFKRDHPVASVLILLAIGYIALSLLGSVLVFLFGLALPITVIFIHASFRLRNLKNKLANKLDKFGFKKTPMGFLLDELGIGFDGFLD